MRHFNSGQYDESVKFFSRAIQLDERGAAAFIFRAMALVAQNKIPAALIDIHAAIKLEPRTAGLRLKTAHLLRDLGWPEAAFLQCKRAVLLGPKDPASYELRGDLELALEFKSRAWQSFKKAVELSPQDAGLRIKAGRVLMGMGRIKEAISHCEEALGLESKNAAAHELLGDLETLMGPKDRAARSLKTAINLNPGNAGLRVKTGRLLMELGRIKDAIAHCEEALRLDPANAEAFELRGDLEILMELGKRAWRSLERAIELTPQDAGLRVKAGRVLKDLGQVEKAMAHCKEALRLGPENALAYELRSDLETSIGLKDRARLSLKRAMALDPRNTGLIWKSIENLRKTSKFENALRQCERVITLEGTSASGLEIKAHLESKLGMTGRACQTLGSAIKLGKDLIPIRLQLFRLLVEQARYRDAIREGEWLLDHKPTLEAIRVFSYPWPAEHIDEFRSLHLRRLKPLLRSRNLAPWALYYQAILSNNPAEMKPLFSLPHARYGWMYFKAGHLLLLSGKNREAIKCLGTAARQKPLEWRCWGFMAEAHMWLGQTDLAMPALDKALETAGETERGDVLAWKGGIELWIGRYRAALKTLDEACARRALWAYCWRGAVKVVLGRPGQALADLDEALRLYPMDREASVWRGEALRKLGRLDESLEQLSRKPVGVWALFNRALVKNLLGDDAGMRSDYESIPPQFRHWAAAHGGLRDEDAMPDRNRLRILREGLKQARGWRRWLAPASRAFVLPPSESNAMERGSKKTP